MTTVLFVNIFASEHRDISGLSNIPLLEDTHTIFIQNSSKTLKIVKLKTF